MVIDGFGGLVFPLMMVSQGISCVTILWVCYIFSCMCILILYLFKSIMGYVEMVILFIASFLTYGCTSIKVNNRKTILDQLVEVV